MAECLSARCIPNYLSLIRRLASPYKTISFLKSSIRGPSGAVGLLRRTVDVMRVSILAAAILLNAGCTTLRPIEGTAAELQQRINSGELLKPGDRVLITTSDEKAHRFAVTAMSAGNIEGKNGSVPVDQVVGLQKRQFSRGKTIALVAGIAGGVALGAFIYAIAHVAPAFAFQ